jgi:hypothetical protein
MFTITESTLKQAYADVEIVKGKLDHLFYKWEEGDFDGSDRKISKRFEAAKDRLDEASHILLEALDSLRT